MIVSMPISTAQPNVCPNALATEPAIRTRSAWGSGVSSAPARDPGGHDGGGEGGCDPSAADLYSLISSASRRVGVYVWLEQAPS
jgi:hypothetical protein